jgi:flagellar basal body rod protein FlgC
MNAMEISRTGLDVEWRRLEIIAQNIANADTTRTASGRPYRPLQLISGPRTNFTAYLHDGRGSAPASALNGVAVYGVRESNAAPSILRTRTPTRTAMSPILRSTMPARWCAWSKPLASTRRISWR